MAKRVRAFTEERPSKPRFSSSSDLFARKGNPWLSVKDQVKSYPLSHSREAERQPTKTEKDLAEIAREAARLTGKARGDFAPPSRGHTVDPEMDQFTVADVAVPKTEMPSEKRKDRVLTAHRKSVNIRLAARARARQQRRAT